MSGRALRLGIITTRLANQVFLRWRTSGAILLRVGISRQQYQRLESKGNPRLDTLVLIGMGLKSELVLIAQGKLNAVLAILADDNLSSPGTNPKPGQTFSLITHPSFPNAAKLMAEPWVRHQRLHPVLSNLLPGGALRVLIAQRLKLHVDNEFHILAYLGEDFPGAIEATPMEPQDVPDSVLNTHRKAKAVKLGSTPVLLQ